MSGPIIDINRNKNEIEDTYMQNRNIPSLLICNQTSNERVQQSLLDNSVLLNNEQIDYSVLNRNYNDRIYERNIPSGNVPVNIDLRPLPADSHCSMNRFQEERDSLEKYNKYEVNLNCKEDIFMPNKGTVYGYFNNIDLDSELKTINQIDTKCTERQYKVDPSKDVTKLNCYKDFLVKDYKQFEKSHGYTWCNLNDCSKLQSFEKCDDINCPPVSSSKLQSGQIVQSNELNQALTDIRLLQDTRNLEMEDRLNNINREPNLKPTNIVQYKSQGATNIYAPYIKKHEVNEGKAYKTGLIKGLKKNLDMRIKNRLEERKTCDPLRTYNPNTKPMNNNKYCNLGSVNNYNLNCRGQTKNLYKFNNLVRDDKDCLYCEQMFNNQTKRKHISVGRVPEHILKQ